MAEISLDTEMHFEPIFIPATPILSPIQFQSCPMCKFKGHASRSQGNNSPNLNVPKGHLSTSATMFYLRLQRQILTWRSLISRRRWHQLAVGTFATKPSLGLNAQARPRKGGLAIYYKPPQATMTHFNDRGMQQKSAKEKRAIQSWHSPLDQIGSLVQIAANESSNNFLQTLCRKQKVKRSNQKKYMSSVFIATCCCWWFLRCCYQDNCSSSARCTSPDDPCIEIFWTKKSDFL